MKDICCPLCSKHNTRFIYQSRSNAESLYGLNYVYCGDCKIAYLNPTPEDADLSGHYSRYLNAEEVQDVSEFKIDSLRKAVINYLNLSKSEDAILDVGCGKGEILHCLLEEGFNIQGIDPYFCANYEGSRLNERLHTKSLTDARFPDDHFSVVMLWSVLEHIADPAQLLAEISRITKSGGRLAVSVPNFKTLQHRLMKQHWPGFVPPEHLFVYSGAGLKKLVEKFGFKTQKQFSDPVCDQWMLKNSVYRFLQCNLRNRTKSEQTSKNFNKVERSLVGLFSFLFVKAEAIIGNSASANIVFKKT